MVELNGIPLIEGEILTYNGQDYTFKGEEKFIVNAKGQTPRHEITRIILDNPTTTIRLEFEKNKDFLQRKTKIYTLEDLKCRFYSTKKYSRFARCRACKLWVC